MSADFRRAAVEILTRHNSYTLNRSRTRIRCNGEACAAILDTPDGEPGAVNVFAQHQADQLQFPEPAVAESAPLVAEPEVPAEAEPEAEVVDEATDEAPEQIDEPGKPELEEADDAPAPTPAKAPKFKRDTKALTATIAELKKGDRVRAAFNHPRYGQFTVEGTVLKGGAGLDRGQLSVAGWYINLNERAAKALQDLTILAAAGKHEFGIPPVTPLPEHVGIGG